MKPRLVLEPITGARWVATTSSSLLLSWLPTAAIIFAFGVGMFVGSHSY